MFQEVANQYLRLGEIENYLGKFTWVSQAPHPLSLPPEVRLEQAEHLL